MPKMQSAEKNYPEIPVTDDEYKRIFQQVIDDGGFCVDLHPDDGNIDISLSQEAFDFLSPKAAQRGLTVMQLVEEAIMKGISGVTPTASLTRQQRRKLERRARKAARRTGGIAAADAGI